jgi:hypothetical protein
MLPDVKRYLESISDEITHYSYADFYIRKYTTMAIHYLDDSFPNIPQGTILLFGNSSCMCTQEELSRMLKIKAFW